MGTHSTEDNQRLKAASIVREAISRVALECLARQVGTRDKNTFSPNGMAAFEARRAVDRIFLLIKDAEQ